MKTGSKNTRRKFLTAAALPSLVMAAPVAAEARGNAPLTRRYFRTPTGTPPPPYSPELAYGNLVFISGKGVGVGFQGDITAQVTRTIDNVEESLKAAGSSLTKVLKVNVYLNDLKDYAGMNEAYAGRFGAEPPVRTTIAAAGGIPGDSLVEIDCIAVI